MNQLALALCARGHEVTVLCLRAVSHGHPERGLRVEEPTLDLVYEKLLEVA